MKIQKHKVTRTNKLKKEFPKTLKKKDKSPGYNQKKRSRKRISNVNTSIKPRLSRKKKRLQYGGLLSDVKEEVTYDPKESKVIVTLKNEEKEKKEFLNDFSLNLVSCEKDGESEKIMFHKLDIKGKEIQLWEPYTGRKAEEEKKYNFGYGKYFLDLGKNNFESKKRTDGNVKKEFIKEFIKKFIIEKVFVQEPPGKIDPEGEFEVKFTGDLSGTPTAEEFQIKTLNDDTPKNVTNARIKGNVLTITYSDLKPGTKYYLETLKPLKNYELIKPPVNRVESTINQISENSLEIDAKEDKDLYFVVFPHVGSDTTSIVNIEKLRIKDKDYTLKSIISGENEHYIVYFRCGKEYYLYNNQEKNGVPQKISDVHVTFSEKTKDLTLIYELGTGIGGKLNCEQPGMEQTENDCWLDSFLYALFKNNNIGSAFKKNLVQNFTAFDNLIDDYMKITGEDEKKKKKEEIIRYLKKKNVDVKYDYENGKGSIPSLVKYFTSLNQMNCSLIDSTLYKNFCSFEVESEEEAAPARAKQEAEEERKAEEEEEKKRKSAAEAAAVAAEAVAAEAKAKQEARKAEEEAAAKEKKEAEEKAKDAKVKQETVTSGEFLSKGTAVTDTNPGQEKAKRAENTSTEGLKMVITEPMKDEKEFPLNGNIVIEFNENVLMNEGEIFIDGKTFNVTTSKEIEHILPQKVIIKPQDKWSKNSEITMTIPKETFKSEDGRRSNTQQEIKFKTRDPGISLTPKIIDFPIEGITDQETVTVKGTAEVDSIISVFIDGEKGSDGNKTDPKGLWSVDLTPSQETQQIQFQTKTGNLSDSKKTGFRSLRKIPNCGKSSDTNSPTCAGKSTIEDLTYNDDGITPYTWGDVCEDQWLDSALFSLFGSQEIGKDMLDILKLMRINELDQKKGHLGLSIRNYLRGLEQPSHQCKQNYKIEIVKTIKEIDSSFEKISVTSGNMSVIFRVFGRYIPNNTKYYGKSYLKKYQPKDSKKIKGAVEYLIETQKTPEIFFVDLKDDILKDDLTNISDLKSIGGYKLVSFCKKKMDNNITATINSGDKWYEYHNKESNDKWLRKKEGRVGSLSKAASSPSYSLGHDKVEAKFEKEAAKAPTLAEKAPTPAEKAPTPAAKPPALAEKAPTPAAKPPAPAAKPPALPGDLINELAAKLKVRDSTSTLKAIKEFENKNSLHPLPSQNLGTTHGGSRPSSLQEKIEMLDKQNIHIEEKSKQFLEEAIFKDAQHLILILKKDNSVSMETAPNSIRTGDQKTLGLKNLIYTLELMKTEKDTQKEEETKIINVLQNEITLNKKKDGKITITNSDGKEVETIPKDKTLSRDGTSISWKSNSPKIILSSVIEYFNGKGYIFYKLKDVNSNNEDLYITEAQRPKNILAYKSETNVAQEEVETEKVETEEVKKEEIKTVTASVGKVAALRAVAAPASVGKVAELRAVAAPAAKSERKRNKVEEERKRKEEDAREAKAVQVKLMNQLTAKLKERKKDPDLNSKAIKLFESTPKSKKVEEESDFKRFEQELKNSAERREKEKAASGGLVPVP